VDVRDAEVWQLLDQRLDEVRRLPYDELLRRTRNEPEEELLERPSGAFRRRTRVIALPNDRRASECASTWTDGGPEPRAGS
jgi:hypothetical protein